MGFGLLGPLIHFCTAVPGANLPGRVRSTDQGGALDSSAQRTENRRRFFDLDPHEVTLFNKKQGYSPPPTKNKVLVPMRSHQVGSSTWVLKPDPYCFSQVCSPTVSSLNNLRVCRAIGTHRYMTSMKTLKP